MNDELLKWVLDQGPVTVMFALAVWIFIKIILPRFFAAIDANRAFITEHLLTEIRKLRTDIKRTNIALVSLHEILVRYEVKASGTRAILDGDKGEIAKEGLEMLKMVNATITECKEKLTLDLAKED